MSGFNKNLDTNSMNYLAFRKILDEEMEVSKRLIRCAIEIENEWRHLLLDISNTIKSWNAEQHSYSFIYLVGLSSKGWHHSYLSLLVSTEKLLLLISL